MSVSSDGGRRHRPPSRSAIATVRRLPTPSAHATAPAASLLAGWLAVLLPATSPSPPPWLGLCVCTFLRRPACSVGRLFLFFGGVSFWSRLLPLPAPLGLPALLLSSSHLLATHDCQLGVTVGNRHPTTTKNRVGPLPKLPAPPRRRRPRAQERSQPAPTAIPKPTSTAPSSPPSPAADPSSLRRPLPLQRQCNDADAPVHANTTRRCTKK